ncbi:MAG: hypothetical protein LC791_07905 [Acidobacteria bacterium]|nr:hypothetical protein [Acidobacteriota bacterium]
MKREIERMDYEALADRLDTKRRQASEWDRRIGLGHTASRRFFEQLRTALAQGRDRLSKALGTGGDVISDTSLHVAMSWDADGQGLSYKLENATIDVIVENIPRPAQATASVVRWLMRFYAGSPTARSGAWQHAVLVADSEGADAMALFGTELLTADATAFMLLAELLTAAELTLEESQAVDVPPWR